MSVIQRSNPGLYISKLRVMVRIMYKSEVQVKIYVRHVYLEGPVEVQLIRMLITLFLGGAFGMVLRFAAN